MSAPEAVGGDSERPHLPVLIHSIIEKLAPLSGVWLDATFGAGGYSTALLEAGASNVFAMDRDEEARLHFERLPQSLKDRISLVQAPFSRLNQAFEQEIMFDGIIFDLGVSSMQIDQEERGFSFLREGPVDMRMSCEGPDAYSLIHSVSEAALADILFHYGEERASRRIARTIKNGLRDKTIQTTLHLAEAIASVLPRAKPGQSHPATRSFQALRIAVNDEFGQLYSGLIAASKRLKEGGWIIVVTFHSLEDRMVKRFLAKASDAGGHGNRFAPASLEQAPMFIAPLRAIKADAAELGRNPRARSARARLAQRANGSELSVMPEEIGMPRLPETTRAELIREGFSCV